MLKRKGLIGLATAVLLMAGCQNDIENVTDNSQPAPLDNNCSSGYICTGDLFGADIVIREMNTDGQFGFTTPTGRTSEDYNSSLYSKILASELIAVNPSRWYLAEISGGYFQEGSVSYNMMTTLLPDIYSSADASIPNRGSVRLYFKGEWLQTPNLFANASTELIYEQINPMRKNMDVFTAPGFENLMDYISKAEVQGQDLNGDGTSDAKDGANQVKTLRFIGNGGCTAQGGIVQCDGQTFPQAISLSSVELNATEQASCFGYDKYFEVNNTNVTSRGATWNSDNTAGVLICGVSTSVSTGYFGYDKTTTGYGLDYTDPFMVSKVGAFSSVVHYDYYTNPEPSYIEIAIPSATPNFEGVVQTNVRFFDTYAIKEAIAGQLDPTALDWPHFVSPTLPLIMATENLHEGVAATAYLKPEAQVFPPLN